MKGAHLYIYTSMQKTTKTKPKNQKKEKKRKRKKIPRTFSIVLLDHNTASMAAGFSPPSPPTIIQTCMTITKPVNKVLMATQNQSSAKKTSPPPQIRIRSSSRNKIFEDQSKGIVCYRDDESEEITCEGYDEGPRPTITSPPKRDAEMIDLLQKNWLRIVTGGDLEGI
ncbi:hypothetical protein U1Q18_006325 [Sarracenia purpurea var. burkii]